MASFIKSNLGRILAIVFVALAATVPGGALAFDERISFTQGPDGNISVVLSGETYPCTYGFSPAEVAIAGFNVAVRTQIYFFGCPPSPGAQPFAYSVPVTLGHFADGTYSVSWSFNPAVYAPLSGAFRIAGGALINPVLPTADLWWSGASEAGWGVNLAVQGDKLFVSAFVYDSAGKPIWLVMPDGRWDPTHTIWTGPFYKMHGSPLTSYSADKLTAGSAGAGTFDFRNPGAATFSYDAPGFSTTKYISRFAFAADATVGSYAGLWWGGPGQEGWGVSVSQQGEDVFATWYSYGSDGEPRWLYMPGATKVAEGHFAGKLYSTSSGAWIGAPFFDGSQTRSTQVGTLDLMFLDVQTGTMTATVDGVKVVNRIQRFRF